MLPCVDRDELTAILFCIADDGLGGLDGGGAILTYARLAAVVQKNVGGYTPLFVSEKCALDSTYDFLRGWRRPVLAHCIPKDGFEAEFLCGAEDVGAAAAVGWTKEFDCGPEGVFDGVVGVAELLADLP